MVQCFLRISTKNVLAYLERNSGTFLGTGFLEPFTIIPEGVNKVTTDFPWKLKFAIQFANLPRNISEYSICHTLCLPTIVRSSTPLKPGCCLATVADKKTLSYSLFYLLTDIDKSEFFIVVPQRLQLISWKYFYCGTVLDNRRRGA